MHVVKCPRCERVWIHWQTHTQAPSHDHNLTDSYCTGSAALYNVSKQPRYLEIRYNINAALTAATRIDQLGPINSAQTHHNRM